MVSSADFWRSTTLLERQFYIPRAFKKHLLSHISKMFLQNNAWYSRFVVLFNLGVIYFLKARERSRVQKEAFGGITSTVDYLNCQVGSKSRGPVRRLMHLVQWTEIPMNFLRLLFSKGWGGGVRWLQECKPSVERSSYSRHKVSHLNSWVSAVVQTCVLTWESSLNMCVFCILGDTAFGFSLLFFIWLK